MMTRLCSIAALALITQGCMPSKQAQKPPQSQTDDGTTSNKITASLKDIGASRLMVVRGSSQTSLADIARQNSAELTVFQFSGTDCIPCKTESPHVGQALAKYGSKVSRVVIFPHTYNEYAPSAYSDFLRSYANNAPFVTETDSSTPTLKAVRADRSQFFGIYVLVNQQGLGQILNMNHAYLKVDETVASILK
jgi:thiol-disulfide isomerase/thioredoxin